MSGCKPCEVGCFCKKHLQEKCFKGCVCEKHSGKTTFKKGDIPWNKGESPSRETKLKISETLKGTVPWNTGKALSQEHKDKLSKSGKGRSVWNKGLIGLGGYKIKGRKNPKCVEDCICKRHYPSPDRKNTPKCIEGCQCWKHEHGRWMSRLPHKNRINKPESKVLELAMPYGFEYVGNRKLWIGNKNPDFWDGKNKVIEMFGDYWHRGEDPQNRINYFKEYGYECIIIWEKELVDCSKVQSRIASFSLEVKHDG